MPASDGGVSPVTTISALPKLDGTYTFQVRVDDTDLTDDPGPWRLHFLSGEQSSQAAAAAKVASVLKQTQVRWLRPAADGNPSGPWIVDGAALAASLELKPPSWLDGEHSVLPIFEQRGASSAIKFTVWAEDPSAVEHPTSAQLEGLPEGRYLALVETSASQQVRMALKKTSAGFHLVDGGGGELHESDVILWIRPK
jgi:hypothetical protein